ncbi:hypothetical protein L226DRAFT_571079 [Lentinus tigrinus ALCF2SS1-7]|uniref:uncharacterized protein n=1 Tax=Lentinus tigrinus ALCF2SS1-7 TaxID=1328758 RepID=UPI001165DCCB|nr:hypothetical protein L226DRAFT_571079 [Lentinus tigrinus ALCF2SS1-7]
MERLDMLYEQSLAELRAFAEREGRAYEESEWLQVKRRMAELHSRSLFDDAVESSSAAADRKELIGRVLRAISQELESLDTLAGLQSFFLVVNPNDPADEGFLGGTIKGREFWRGHRGCGVAGAQAFKAQCTRVQSQLATPTTISAPLPTTLPLSTSVLSRKRPQAREVKSELYGAMRDALRTASGIRNAEMKWTNHSKLDIYGVRLVGWPENVPRQNPSTLSVAQNKLLLDLLNEGKISFSYLEGVQSSVPTVSADEAPNRDEDAMFEDSIDYTWVSEETQEDVGNLDVPSSFIQADSDNGSPSIDELGREGSLRDSGTTPKKRRLEER